MSDVQKNAEALMHEQISIAYEAIEKAVKIADEHGLEFSFDVAYGMGGNYYSPKQVQENDYLQEYYYLDPSEGGWVSSSQTC